MVETGAKYCLECTGRQQKDAEDGAVESGVTEDGGEVPDGMYDEGRKTSKRKEEEE